MRSPNLFLALAFLVLLSGCLPGGEYNFDVWDADADHYITEDEFFTTWNKAGYYSAWDVNHDGAISEEEWETGMGNYYRDYGYEAYGAFDDWDLNDDGLLDEDEFGEGTFGLWDENDDNRIEVAEYDSWFYTI